MGAVAMWQIKLIIASLCAWSSLAFARDVGAISQDLYLYTHGAAGIVKTICLLTAVALLIGAMSKYQERRRHPEDVSLWVCIVRLLLGLALIALSFIPMPQ
jgi:hypothetical protein